MTNGPCGPFRFFAFGAYSGMAGLCCRLVVVLLCGGDKSSQEWDIALANTIAAQWTE